MSDFLADCNSGELRIDPKTFTETWCVRCSRADCGLAGFAKNDLMAIRNATWRERYFGDNQADLSIPKFAEIAGINFPNMIKKAVQRAVSEGRGDWSVPEIEITDGRIVQASLGTTKQVDEAVRQLRRPEEFIEADEPEYDEPEYDEPEYDEPEYDEPEPPPDSEPRRGPPVQARPAHGNTPDQGAVMIGGSPAPVKKTAADPWAPPAAPTHTVVEVGATIKFGGSKTDD